MVQDTRIVAIGTCGEMKQAYPDADIVDFGDAIITPLLVNAHTHLELTDYPVWEKSFADEIAPQTFVDWIIRLIGIKRNLSSADYRHSLQHGLQQSLAAGTGTVGDILSAFDIREVYESSSLNGFLYLETLGHQPDRIATISVHLHHVLEEENVGGAVLGVAPHSPYTISSDYLSRIYAWCSANRCRCTTHVAESLEEVTFLERGKGALAETFYPHVGWEQYLSNASGRRPVSYLEQHGGLFSENLLVHGVQLDDTEISLLAEKDMSLVLCPRSNAKLNVGKAPAGQLLQRGVNLALGTDSLASCDTLSIWDEMAFAHRWFEGEVDAPTLFYMATLGGAKSLGLSGEVGSLNVGKLADFQILQPEMIPVRIEIYDYFVSPDCTDDIVHVYKQGKLLD